ncbi:hypothetical protein LguiB_003271 [Lonicera macranthoides]
MTMVHQTSCERRTKDWKNTLEVIELYMSCRKKNVCNTNIWDLSTHSIKLQE